MFQEEFGYNAETQKLLCKNGETLLGAINFFIASVNTLVNKTIEDTLIAVKQYENARYTICNMRLTPLNNQFNLVRALNDNFAVSVSNIMLCTVAKEFLFT